MSVNPTQKTDGGNAFFSFLLTVDLSNVAKILLQLATTAYIYTAWAATVLIANNHKILVQNACACFEIQQVARVNLVLYTDGKCTLQIILWSFFYVSCLTDDKLKHLPCKTDDKDGRVLLSFLFSFLGQFMHIRSKGKITAQFKGRITSVAKWRTEKYVCKMHVIAETWTLTFNLLTCYPVHF